MSAPLCYIRSQVWRSASGRSVSMYGALPWYTDAQKAAEGWHVETRGWIPAWPDGTVGAGRQPHDTVGEARAFYGPESEPARTQRAIEASVPCADCGEAAALVRGEEVCGPCHKARQDASAESFIHGAGEPS